MKKYSVHIIWAIVAVAALVGGWYYGKSTAASGLAGARAGFSSSTRNFAGRTGAGGGFAAGVVTAKDAQSITLQLPDGNSEVVFYSSSTAIVKPMPASVSDIAIGANVMVGGTQNSDGSVTATTIQVRGANMPGPGGNGAGGSGGATGGTNAAPAGQY